MHQKYPFITLGQLLRRAERFEENDNSQEYQFAGTYSFARGIFLSERKFGSSFRLPKIQRIHAGDFVYCKIMAWEGAFGLVPEEVHNSVMSGAFVAYEIDHTQIDAKYLAYYFKIPSVWKSIGSQSTGTNVRRRSLHPEQFEKASIPLPPLEEQRSIVARIEELATKIEEARGLRREAVEEAEVILPIIFTKAYDKAAKIAGGVKRLNDLCLAITDGTHITPNYVSEGIPFLSVKDITTGTIKFDNVRFISPQEYELLTRRYKPERGDILFTKVGTTGFAKAIDVDREFSIFVSLALLKLDRSRLDPNFAEYMLNSSYIKGFSEAGTRGVGNKNLVLKFIRDFPIPAPPLREQQRIVSYLDDLQAKVDALKHTQAKTSAELDAMLPSILDKAFKGEL